MKKFLKKALCGVTAALMLLSSCAYAQGEDAKDTETTKYTVKYIRSAEEYDYSSECEYIGKNKASGEIIPFAIGPSDGYSYALLPEDEDFYIEKTEYKNPYTDVNTDFYRYNYSINEMSARGVFKGYADGSFGPANNLTRAEMAVIFARLFSVKPVGGESGFTDVAPDHWACESINALTDAGVFKKDEKFNPSEPITREQLTAMTYRMLERTGYIGKNKGEKYFEYKDASDISDFAKGAYDGLLSEGYSLIQDMDEHDVEDFADDEYFAKPQSYVNRGECTEFFSMLIRNFMYKNAPAIRFETAPTEEIPVLDGSTSTYPITQNIYYGYFQNAENNPDMPKSHSKTSNSYKRLIDGEVELIFVPDPSEDIKKYAEEKGVKLKYTPIANEALVFFTANDNKVDNITAQQLYDIYVDNKYSNWNELGGDDAFLAPYCRNNDSGSHAQMEKFILNGKDLNPDIARERTSVMMASILTDVDSYNHQNPGKYAMGYSLYYYFNNVQMVIGDVDLKLMKINGIEPTDETISNGEYPFTTNYYAVSRDEENPKVDAFLKLMQSEFGDDVISASGLGVIKR